MTATCLFWDCLIFRLLIPLIHPRPCSCIGSLLPVFHPANKNENPCYIHPLTLGRRSRKGRLFDSAVESAILVLLELFGAGADVDVLEKMVKTMIL
jgi:hypothetical protein